jgi:hypothetical protein
MTSPYPILSIVGIVIVGLTIAAFSIWVDRHIRPELPPGVAGLSAGLPPQAGVKLPAWEKIARPK